MGSESDKPEPVYRGRSSREKNPDHDARDADCHADPDAPPPDAPALRIATVGSGRGQTFLELRIKLIRIVACLHEFFRALLPSLPRRFSLGRSSAVEAHFDPATEASELRLRGDAGQFTAKLEWTHLSHVLVPRRGDIAQALL